MRNAKLYRALSRATGEPMQRLQKMGFSVIRVVSAPVIDVEPRKRQRKEGKSRAA